MQRDITYPGTPGPKTDPGTEQNPVPERPEPQRKPFVQPTFVKNGLMALALVAASVVNAQSTPTPAPVVTQNPTGQQPATVQQPRQGWTMFNEDVGTRIKVDNVQAKRLSAIDAMYQERYTALGEKPWTNTGYTPLTQQRNAEIQQVLTPEQYKSWSTTYGGALDNSLPPTPLPDNTRNAPTSTPTPVQP